MHKQNKGVRIMALTIGIKNFASTHDWYLKHTTHGVLVKETLVNQFGRVTEKEIEFTDKAKLLTWAGY